MSLQNFRLQILSDICRKNHARAERLLDALKGVTYYARFAA